MGQVEAFDLPGCRCWMWTGDHDAPHFHAGSPDDWEIRIFFLEEPVTYEVKYQFRHLPSQTVRRLLRLAAENRAALLDQWNRSVADD
jgi:hypothetical protein